MIELTFRMRTSLPSRLSVFFRTGRSASVKMRVEK